MKIKSFSGANFRPQSRVDDRKMRPTEWAMEEKLDPHLFLYWKNNLMTNNEFQQLKKQVM